jgi:hypothetical protein
LSWRSRRTADRCFVSEAQALIKAASGTPQMGDRTKRQVERAARATGLTYWQAFDLWYGKASAKAAELFVHRITNTTAQAAQRLADARAQEDNDARSELAILKARIAEIEARIGGVGEASPA